MGIKDAVKKVKQYVTDKIDDYKTAQEEDKELNKCKKLLERAMGEHDLFRAKAAKWDEQYNGTHSVGPNVGNNYVSNRDRTDDRLSTTQDARQVVNITSQLIEAQIDITVPVPSVEAIEGDDDDERRKMIEGQLKYMSNGAETMRINSENERIVKKNSLAVYKVMFDPDTRSHKWIGAVKTTNPHPINVVPQPGQYRVESMDYMFHIENRTIDQICEKYEDDYKKETGRDLRDDIDEFGSREYNYLEDFSAETHNTDTTQEKYSVVEKWYKDKDRDVCLYSWCGMVRLKKMEKFFYKRDEEDNIIEEEDIDIQKPEIDMGTGQPVTGPDGQPQMKTETVKVKCRVPKRFPFVIQYNIPREKSYIGKSDPELIFDQQEGIKKMLSIEEEKLIKGTTKIITKKGSKLKDLLNNSVTQVVETENPAADIKVIDMKTPDQSYKELYHIYVQAAKDQLGVSDVSLGMFAGGHMSARAIDALSQNAHSRMNIKQFEKNIAYMELYRLWFEFLLAYYDEKRPYRIDGPENKPIFGYFDKSKLIKQDDDGQWYFAEFDIFIATDSPLPKDKKTIIESANKAGSRMDNVEYWMVMDSIGYPNAGDILERERKKEQNQQGQPKDMPHESVAFKDMPIAGKIQMAKQMGIELKEEDFQSQDPNQPAQQPIDPHGPAMELTKMHIDQHNADSTKQHELEKIALQHRSSTELAAQKHEQTLQTIAAKAQIDAALNEQKAGHVAVMAQPPAGSGGNAKN